jgi:MinD superfamily P-loop ATPase
MIFILVFTGEGDSMKIAVLSGKGGTGKTLISVNMAAVLQKSVYIDCDVEEPNGHLFFKPVDVRSEKVSVKIPVADDNLCNGCRKCVDFCKYNALVYVNDRLMVFEDICHSCGGCVLLCPERALSERDKVIGEVRGGVSENVTIISGVLNTGEVSGTPIIKELISRISREERPVIIDCPPGSACIVMESIKDADYCILVAEPTLFGVHNLDMVCELVRLFDKPYGVIVNKCMDGENPAEEYCVKNGIRILGKIPYDEELGRLNSNGLIAAWVESKRYRELFKSLYQKVAGEVQA